MNINGRERSRRFRDGFKPVMSSGRMRRLIRVNAKRFMNAVDRFLVWHVCWKE